MPPPKPALLTRVLRYAMAAVGPVGSAIAQFALSLLLLRALSPDQFGMFSFLLVAANFSAGLWGALFCAPLPVLLAQRDAAGHPTILRALFASNLVGALGAFIIFAGVTVALGGSPSAAALFSGYAGLSLLRWFARTHAYATGQPLRTMWSDLAYSVTLLAGVGVAVALGIHSLDMASAALLGAVAVGLLPFGRVYLGQQLSRFRLHELRDYREVWRQHASWSLLGVVTTEATTNSHAYIVTALSGPSAFAPIAACALLLRPIQVAMNALMEFERAQMARQIGEQRIAAARDAAHFFRRMLIVAWLGTVAVAALLLAYWPRLLFPEHYDLSLLRSGTALWMAVAGVRLWRTPESALLQAAGAFQALAYASVLSAGVSIAAVFGLLTTAGVTWSIAGILAGEMIFASWTWWQAHRWYSQQRAVLSFARPTTHRLLARPELSLVEEASRP